MPTKHDKPAVFLPLTIANYARQRLLPVDYLIKTWGLKEVEHLGVRCIEQPYTRKDGTVGPPRFRYGTGSDPSKMSPVDCGPRMILYGQKQLRWDDAPYCFLVEGESDTQTLHFSDNVVLGIPGCKTWRTCINNDIAILDWLSNREVILVIQEPPSAAEKRKGLDSPAAMVQEIKNSLPNTAVVAVKLWEFAPKDEKGEPVYKDASGLWMHHGGTDRFYNALNIAVRAASEQSSVPQRKIELICADDVQPKLTPWLWANRIPLNKVSVFSGMAERGKSTVATDLIARLTTGKDFPDGKKNTIGPCDVIILASEEDYDEDIVPRLIAATADRKKVLFAGLSTVDGDDPWPIALDRDLGLLRGLIANRPNVKLIVIDPITSYLGSVDPNRPKEVRPFMDKLKQFAKEVNISILLIIHFSKNPDVSALHRSGGAATWTDAPRAVWMFDKKKGEDETTTPRTHVMVPGKLNKVAAEQRKTLEFTLKSVDVEIESKLEPVAAIAWGAETDLTLDQQFKADEPPKKKPGPPPIKIKAAMQWLQNHLESGPQPANDVLVAGQDAGHALQTLRNAADRLDINSGPQVAGGPYFWSLSSSMVADD